MPIQVVLGILECISRAFPELLHPLHTVALGDHLTSATRHPEVSHANCKVLRHDFREAGAPNTHGFCVLGWEAEGSAPLHRRVIQDSAFLGSSGAEPLPRIRSMVKEQSIGLGS
jgi:hypothetical protein